MTRKGLSVSLSAVVVAMAGGTALATPMTDYNLVVLGNLNNSSQDIEGRTFVGQDFSGGSPTVAKNLNAAANLGVNTFDVFGNVNVQNINLQAGNIRFGGTFNGNVNFNGGGSGVQSKTQQTVALAALKSVMQNEMTGLSSHLQTLSPNSTATFPGGPQPGPVTFNAVAGVGGLAVFNVDASNIFSPLMQQMNLNLGPGVTNIVINVTGVTVNFNTGNFVGNWQNAYWRAHTIWNFHQATSLNFQNNFNGAVLAPIGTLTNHTAIDGSVFVGSMAQQGEVHLPLYQGYIPAPGAAALLGLAGIAAGRRRR